MSTLSAREYKCFEDIKRTRLDGTEYWTARELAPVLDYAKWEDFYKVIKRAMIACENSGRSVSDDFPEVRKIVEAGATRKTISDYELSRYACYLIVQNGDPRKEVIALGQTYFAIQTYRQEVADRFNQLDEDTASCTTRSICSPATRPAHASFRSWPCRTTVKSWRGSCFAPPISLRRRTPRMGRPLQRSSLCDRRGYGAATDRRRDQNGERAELSSHCPCRAGRAGQRGAAGTLCRSRLCHRL